MPTVVVPETRIFKEEEAQELLTALPPSVLKESDDSDIDSDLIRQGEKFPNNINSTKRN